MIGSKWEFEEWAEHEDRKGLRNLIVAIVLEAMWRRNQITSIIKPCRYSWLASQPPDDGSWKLTRRGWELVEP